MNPVMKFVRRGSQEIECVPVEPLFVAGNYAIIGLVNQVENGVATFIEGQYTILYIPNGRGGDVWFTSKKNAVGFCKWLHKTFPVYDDSGTAAEEHKTHITEALRKYSGHYSAYVARERKPAGINGINVHLHSDS